MDLYTLLICSVPVLLLIVTTIISGIMTNRIRVRMKDRGAEQARDQEIESKASQDAPGPYIH